ncbi:MAG: HD domain-containing protein [candidate division WOR-3 bacterium]|nr:MAG: HD domain-containing protein [candidate division WOR-3 bacterium]
MKSQYVDELKAGQSVKEIFVLGKKIVKDKKDGGVYAILEFSDRTGTIDGISWDGDSLGEVTAGDFVFVTGNVTEYSGRLQVVVNSMSQVEDGEVDATDFLPTYLGDINSVMKALQEFRTSVRDKNLRQLLDSFFDDNEFMILFRLAPAAKRVHHAYLGGLAVHTLSVLRLLRSMQSVYEFLNADLLITAGILHDVGKIEEYTYKKSINISDRGRLLGHIVIGSEMVAERLRQIPDFPKDLRLKILHMILSHHGEKEWGSPKQPLFPEALVLHYADNLDSKIEMMRQIYSRHRGQNKQWSDYHPFLEREIYLGEES